MNAGLRIAIVTAIATGLLGISLPVGSAESPAMKLGLFAEGYAVAQKDLAPGVSVQRLGLEAFSGKTLSRLDGIILGPAEGAALASDPASASLLHEFLLSGKPVFLTGDAPELMNALDVGFLGGDVASTDGVDATSGQSITGVFVNEDGSIDTVTYSFNSVSDLPRKAVGRASRMVIDHLHKDKSSGGSEDDGGFSLMSTSSSSYWDLRATASYCAEKAPYGRVCYYASFLRLMEDGSSTYDWWNVVMETQATPGYVLWGNTWFTNRMWTLSDTDAYRLDNKLVDWGPESAYNLATVTYSIGTTAGVLGAVITNEMSVSYELDRVAAYQSSSGTYNDFSIRHEIDYGTGHAYTTYTTKAGFTERVPNGGSLKIPYTNKAEFWDYSNNNFAQVYINSWREIW